MRLHQIRHATAIIEYNEKRFLIDPMFAPKGVNDGSDANMPIVDVPWPFHDLPVPPKDIIKNIDAVIITHLHPDHFDKFAQEILPKGINIFVQDLYDKYALEKEHFNNIEVLSLEGTCFEGITIYKTECMQGIRELAEPLFLANGMRWEAMGFVLKKENEPTIYFAGDTVMYKGVINAIELHKPKYIVLNTSCSQISYSGPINMGINDIKALHEYYPDGKILTYHMDCIENATLSRTDLSASEIKNYIYSPADGEIMYLE